MLRGFSCCCLLIAVLLGDLLTPLATATSIPLGELTVRSQPGVEVVWDGIFLGVTDDKGVMKIGQIPPGGYSLALRLEGFEGRSFPLEVATGSQTVNLPLTANVAASSATTQSIPPSGPDPQTLISPAIEPKTKPVQSIPPLSSEVADDSLPSSSDEATLSAPTQSIWPTVLAAVVIVVAAIAIFRLARHRPQPATSTSQADGPKVVLGSLGQRSSRGSGVLRDLKSREDSLENFIEAGSGGLKRRVLDMEVVDHPPVDKSSGGER